MNDNTAPDEHPLNLIAAQYVLGVLSPAARERVKTRMMRDGDLRALVFAWERQLSPLANLLEPVDVPEHVWQAIEAKIQLAHKISALTAETHTAQPLPSTNTTPINISSTPNTSSTSTAAPTPTTKAAQTEATQNSSARPAANDGYWKKWATASSALAAGLAAFMVFRPDPVAPNLPPQIITVQQPAAQDVAVLTASDKTPAWIVRKQADKLVLSNLNAASVPTDRDLELWSIAGGNAPRSLGVIHLKDGQAQLPNAVAELLAKDSILAISLEPTGGSPTGAPTGAVLYTGAVVKS